MIEEAITHPDKDLEVLPLPHSRSLTSSPLDARTEDASFAARPGSPNHSLGKVASDAQLHLKAVNPSPAASRKMPLPVPMPSTLSESSRYLSTDSSTTTARSGIESITATQPASKGFSEAVMTSRPSAWAPPKRQEDVPPPPRPAVVETPPSQPALRPAPLQNSSGSGSSWSTPTLAQTSAVAVHQSALQAVDMGVPGKTTQVVRCKSSEPLEVEVPEPATTELPPPAPHIKHSRSFSDPAGVLDVTPPDEAMPTEPGSVPLDTRLKAFPSSTPAGVSPRVSGQESNVESLRDSIVGGDGNEPSASIEQAPAKENSEGKRPDGKEMNLAVSSPSSAGDQSVLKTTKTVAVITPTPVCVV